ncbi:MAG TPA: hypothetical protein VJ953_20185 [Saprospiraceae bacterium]|nr:hypothetical protein [Saprospiraceae bacterium]
MIKSILIGIISFMSIQSSEVLMEEMVPNDEVPCRITCTITMPNREGRIVTASATAGGIFTSCTKAREKACAEALAMIKDER